MSLTTFLGYTPIFRIDQGDNDITGAFQDRLVSIRIESYSSNGRGDHCEIVVDDRDWLIASPSTLSGSSTTLAISLGYKENVLWEMGTFALYETAYTYPAKSMQLLGSAIDLNSDAKAPVITHFDGKTLGEVINAIAESAGVNSSIDGDLGSKQIPYLNVHSSHMHLLQELERRYNAMAKFSDGTLSFTKRDGTTVSGAGYGDFTLGPNDFGQFSLTEQRRTAYSKVRVGYLDRVENRLMYATSSTAPGTDSTVPYLVKRPFPSQEEAQDHANATMASLNRGLRQGSLTLAKGDPSIKGGMKFTIAGTRDGVDGDYMIETATHMFVKDQGISTSLSFYNAGAGPSSNGETPEETATPDTYPVTTPAGSGPIGSA